MGGLAASKSIEEHEFHDFDMLDAKISSALKRIITTQYFRRRVMSKSRMPKNTTDFFEENRLFT